MTSRAPAASSAPAVVRSRPGRSALCGLALLAVLLAPAERAGGQAIERPADQRPELPEFEAPVEQELILPPLPPTAEPREQLSAGPGVFIQGYRIVGSTVFSQQELEGAVAPWAGRTIRSEDLVAVRNALTQLYIGHGYVNSGAVLPDQEFEDGIVELRIIEGSLGEIRISGNEQFRDRYLRDRIELGVTAPLDVRKLERQIQILQQDPRIRRVAARLAPGDRLGEAVLYIEVEEASRFHADLRFSNYEPPSIGALAGQIEGAVANPTGWGDTLRAQFTISEGLNRYRGLYELPFTRWGTLLSLDARYAEAEITESPFDDLDIESTFQSYQIGLLHPVYRSPRTLVQIGVTGDWRRTRTKLLGNSFSFPGSGAQDGEATAAVLRFLFEWLQRDQKQVFAARSQLSWGIDALGATINSGDDPDGRFLAWLLQLQWARRFGTWGIEAIVRGDLQLASDPLLTMEQIAVGGYSTVRGYRQNQRVQDQGVVASLEVRLPIWRQPERWGVIQLAPFVDFGRTWDHRDRPGSRKKTLASVGVGLRWAMTRFFDARIYWGQNLTSVETSGDLQDHGVQFMISASFP
jgi:hemolysin activation/secretion protein